MHAFWTTSSNTQFFFFVRLGFLLLSWTSVKSSPRSCCEVLDHSCRRRQSVILKLLLGQAEHRIGETKGKHLYQFTLLFLIWMLSGPMFPTSSHLPLVEWLLPWYVTVMSHRCWIHILNHWLEEGAKGYEASKKVSAPKISMRQKCQARGTKNHKNNEKMVYLWHGKLAEIGGCVGLPTARQGWRLRCKHVIAVNYGQEGWGYRMLKWIPLTYPYQATYIPTMVTSNVKAYESRQENKRR